MRQRHTTTASFKTYFRIFLLLLISTQFSFLVPFFEGADAQLFFWNQAVNMGILYAIIVGFLMSLSLTRKQTLEEKIGIELNKIRRLYHLALNMRNAEPRLDPWFKEMVEALRGYLTMFCNKTFAEYEEGDPLFRKVTYTAYSIPARKVPYNSELYQFVLDTTADATEARQFIKQKKDDYIGYFQWAVIIVITLTYCFIMTAATPHEFIPRMVTTIVIFNLFLALDLLNEYDRLNSKKNVHLAEMYVENLPQITVCPMPRKRLPAKKRAASLTDS